MLLLLLFLLYLLLLFLILLSLLNIVPLVFVYTRSLMTIIWQFFITKMKINIIACTLKYISFKNITPSVLKLFDKQFAVVRSTINVGIANLTVHRCVYYQEKSFHLILCKQSMFSFAPTPLQPMFSTVNDDGKENNVNMIAFGCLVILK